MHGEAVRGDQERVAAWVLDALEPSYGPWGGHKLVGEELLTSGASALREGRPVHTDARPYVGLAAAVQAHAGDQATGALLLAARLVHRGLRLAREGVPVPATLEGYGLAARQSAAVLASLRLAVDPPRALRHVARLVPGLAETVLDGLPRLVRDGRVDLEAVDVQEGPGLRWSDGLVVAPLHAPAPRSGPSGQAGGASRVLILERGPRFGPEGAAHRVRSVGALAAVQAGEEAVRRAFVDAVRALDADLVACPRSIDEACAERLAGQGVLVVTDAPRTLLRRLAGATGARAVLDAASATSPDLGRGRIRRRPLRRGGWTVEGAGPAATLEVPTGPPVLRAAVEDECERLLRAAGRVLADGGALPGGGRWQRDVAAALRHVADHAPGKAPLAVRSAADAFDALADALVRNAGHDPLADRLPPGAEDVLDPAACVAMAVPAAFEAAVMVLRVDARHTRTASSPQRLRGGTGPVGSPRGLPGDVPPLM